MRHLAALVLSFFVFATAIEAQDNHDAVTDQSGQSQNSQPALAVLPLTKRADLAWQALLEPLAADKIELASAALNNLKELRAEYGLESFEEYSLFLIVTGLDDLRHGENARAKFRAQAALDLSPHSPRVLSGGAQLFRLTGVLGSFEHAARLVSASIHDPLSATGMVVKAAYPILWAATLALYIAFVFAVIADFRSIRSVLQRFFPSEFQGPTLLVGLMLILPLPFGILWSLAIWGAMLGSLVPGRRWHAFAAGVLLVLWGSVIPIRENLTAWITDPGQAVALKVQAGDFQVEADRLLTQLSAIRPDDGIAVVARAQIALYQGDIALANALLDRAGVILTQNVSVTSMRGLLAALSGDFAKAKTFMQSALDQAAPSAELLFNYSKVQFELLDHAASRELLGRAREKDAALINLLEQRETKYPNGVFKGYAPIRIDAGAILSSGLGALPSASAQADVVSRLMMNTRPFTLVGLGCVLIVLFMVRSPKGRALPRGDAKLVPPLDLLALIIPGATNSSERHLAKAFLVLFMLLLAFFALIGWPAESAELARAFPGFKPLYALIFALTVVGLMGRNIYTRRH